MHRAPAVEEPLEKKRIISKSPVGAFPSGAPDPPAGRRRFVAREEYELLGGVSVKPSSASLPLRARVASITPFH
jgi:hypothetical protein